MVKKEVNKFKEVFKVKMILIILSLGVIVSYFILEILIKKFLFELSIIPVILILTLIIWTISNIIFFNDMYDKEKSTLYRNEFVMLLISILISVILILLYTKVGISYGIDGACEIGEIINNCLNRQ